VKEITKKLKKIATGPEDGAVFLASLSEIKDYYKENLAPGEKFVEEMVIAELISAVQAGEIEVYDMTSKNFDDWQFHPIAIE
jgi:hypothetical protein